MLYFQHTVYSLSHYLCFTLDCASAQIIFLEDIISHRIVCKLTLDFLNRTLYIVKIDCYIIIHKSAVFSYRREP